MEQLTAQLVEWAGAARAHGGNHESGDACLVRVFPDSALVAVVDGLGHGAEAASAARHALALLGGADWGDPIAALRRCHEGLRTTRGVVMSLARFDGARNTMTWAGVGNVEGVVLRSAKGSGPGQALLRQGNGVVGRQLPPVHAALVPVKPGDTLVVATDGIRPQFVSDLVPPESLQAMADRILAEFGSGVDDALVMAVRYRGVVA